VRVIRARELLPAQKALSAHDACYDLCGKVCWRSL
jgi:hypothetical protein